MSKRCWRKTARQCSNPQAPVFLLLAQPETVLVRPSAPSAPRTRRRRGNAAPEAMRVPPWAPSDFPTGSGPSWAHWPFCAKDHNSPFTPDNGTHTRDWQVSCEEPVSKLLDLWGCVVSAATAQQFPAAPKQLETTREPTGMAVFPDNLINKTGDRLSFVNSDISPSFHKRVINASP